MAAEINLQIAKVLPDAIQLGGLLAGVTVSGDFLRRGGFNSKPASPETTAPDQTDEVVSSPATEGGQVADLPKISGGNMSVRRNQIIPTLAQDFGSEGPAA